MGLKNDEAQVGFWNVCFVHFFGHLAKRWLGKGMMKLNFGVGFVFFRFLCPFKAVIWSYDV